VGLTQDAVNVWNFVESGPAQMVDHIIRPPET